MSPLSAVRQTAGAVAGAAEFAVRHPARTALRLVGAARGAARVVGGDARTAGRATVVPPSEPGIPPIPAPEPSGPTGPPAPVPMPSPEPVPGPGPEPTPEPDGPTGPGFAHEVSPVGHDDRHAGTAPDDLAEWRDGLDGGTEIITDAGTTGLAPEINPATGLPHHAPGR